MPIKLNRLLFVLGGFALGVGVVLGFAPLSTSGGLSCGSAFGQIDTFAPGAPVSIARCNEVRSSRHRIALPLIIAGELLTVGGATKTTIGNPGQARIGKAKQAAGMAASRPRP